MSEPIVFPSTPPLEPPPGAPGDLPPPPPEGLNRPVARLWTRVGEVLLEFVLMACTFGFGWVGWWIIAWADGQSPAKVVLRLHVVNQSDGRLASFGRMALREVAGKGIPGTLALIAIFFGRAWLLGLVAVYVVVSGGLAIADSRRRTLWDRLARTVVLEGDPPPVSVPAAVSSPAEGYTAPV
jgi:hypothetical protein